MTKEIPLSAFPVRAFDKIRYGDTDRQGHVNNAVFATYLETGRVALLYQQTGPADSSASRAEAGSSFVIARLELDFQREITWPGTVEIGTVVESVGRSSVKLQQALYQHDRCVAYARTVIVLMDQTTRRSRPLPAALVEHFSALRGPLVETPTG